MWLKRILGLISTVFLFFSITSCQKHTDTRNETNLHLNPLIVQALDSAENNPTFSRLILKKAMTFSPDSLSYYEALNAYAYTYSCENQIDSSYKYSCRVLNYCNRQPETTRIYDLIGETFKPRGDFLKQSNLPDSAIYLYNKALRFYSIKQSPRLLPEIYINLADIFSKKGNYAPSVNYFRKALYLSDSLHVTQKMGYPIYFGLGQIYKDLRDFELSDSYFRMAEKYYERRSLCEKFVFCNNRAGFYYDLNDFSKALFWSVKAFNLVSVGEFSFCRGVTEVNLADIYLNLGNLDSTRYYLDRSIDYFSRHPSNLAEYYIRTIEIGLALRQNNLPRVRMLLKKNENLKDVDLSMISLRNKQLEGYYAKMGDFRQAYLYQSRNQDMNDSILADRSLKSAAELDVRYKLDTTVIRKDLLIHNQESQLKDLRLTQFVWILICVLVLTIAFFSYLYGRRQHDLQRLKHMDQVTRLRMQNIRNQISPHFVLNILNREIISVDESKRNGLYGLAKLLRESLEMTEKASVTLAQELEFVKTYIELERSSLGPDFKLDLEVDAQLNQNQVKVPPMLIQIPVENAIKHALRPKKDEKILCIRITKEPKGLRIDVQDNGAGYFPGEISKNRGTGTGMNVLYQTVQLLNSRNIEKISFKFCNIDNQVHTGAVVEIFIPDDFKYE